MMMANGHSMAQGRGLDEGSNTGYHFAYTQLSGDGEMIAKVESLDNTDRDAGAALVLRTSLTNNGSDCRQTSQPVQLREPNFLLGAKMPRTVMAIRLSRCQIFPMGQCG